MLWLGCQSIQVWKQIHLPLHSLQWAQFLQLHSGLRWHAPKYFQVAFTSAFFDHLVTSETRGDYIISIWSYTSPAPAFHAVFINVMLSFLIVAANLGVFVIMACLVVQLIDVGLLQHSCLVPCKKLWWYDPSKRHK